MTIKVKYIDNNKIHMDRNSRSRKTKLLSNKLLIKSVCGKQEKEEIVHCTNDGVDGSPLPLFSSRAHTRGSALYRNGHNRRPDTW